MIKKILKFLITIVIMIVLFRLLNFKVSSLLSDVKHWGYIFFAACCPLSVTAFFSVNRWRLFLSETGIHEKFFSLWKINLVSLFQGLIIPSSHGHDVLRIYYIEKRNPGKKGIAGSTVIIERLFGLLILSVFCLFALPFIKFSGDPRPLYFSVLLVCFSGFGLFFLSTIPSLHKLYAGRKTRFLLLNKCIKYFELLHGALITFPYKKIFLSTVWFIAGFQLAHILIVYLLFHAYGHPVPFVYHIAVYPIIGIYAMIPVTIGGFGVRESCFAFFYAQLGVPPDIAICVSITNYLACFLLPALVGGLLYCFDAFSGQSLATPRDAR